MSSDNASPWDGRDHEEQSEIRFNAPLRTKNRMLEDENMRLKRLLRTYGIPWSDTVAAHHAFQTNDSIAKSGRRRSSRLSAAGQDRSPHLPVEVILRILHYAMISDDPIIDPLSKLSPEALTSAEAKRGPQVAIGFLATCKAYHNDGTRILWSQNKFTFTSVSALRKFSELEPEFRRGISCINLRIIAHYFDDGNHNRKMSQNYHPELTKSQSLKVAHRSNDESSMSRKGFRCYTWTQVVDFLDALRPPFDPRHAGGVRPRLLPGLLSMRMDFVNFPDYLLPPPEADLHEMAAHNFGCTLNELMVTGLPCCESGLKAGGDLQGMVKDDGLFICHAPSYVQQKKHLKALCGYDGLAMVVRAWRKVARERQEASGAHGTAIAHLPTAPEEVGHPKSVWKKKQTIWKRVPIARDSDERQFVEFDRATGKVINESKRLTNGESESEPEDSVCPNCGVVHPIYDSWSDSD